MTAKNFGHQLAVSDIALKKISPLRILPVPIDQVINNNRMIAFFVQLFTTVRTDIARTPGNQDLYHDLPLSSLIVVSLLFLAKYFFGIFLYLRTIDYFRIKIDDLRNAFDYKIILSERRSEATSTNRQLSIVNLQFFFFGSSSHGIGINKLVMHLE
jgi:hypothetical protein